MAIKSSKDNLVSVIMNCFNAEKFIELSIKSVLEQTYTNWELIIWDNCSKDNTSEIIGKFNDKRILYFKSNLHLSLGAARNEALKSRDHAEKLISFFHREDSQSYIELAKLSSCDEITGSLFGQERRENSFSWFNQTLPFPFEEVQCISGNELVPLYEYAKF